MRVKLLDVYIHASTITICLGLSFTIFFPGNFSAYMSGCLIFPSLDQLTSLPFSQLSGIVHTVVFEDKSAALPSLALNF